MIKLRFLIFTLIIPILGCSQANKKDILLDWKNSNSINWISIDSTFEKFTPTIEEMELAKQLSKNHIDSLKQKRNPYIEKNNGELLKFKHPDYYRQYVGYVDRKGNRIIFINAVCSSFAQKLDLNKDWIFVLDGGSCFFQIKVDLSNKKCFDFSVNGNA